MFSEFNCENLKGFLELYLTGYVLQQACWFEELRSVCYNTYGLDCAQFYTASNLSGSACLKVCNPELELLTDRNILDMTKRMTRGGSASVISSRLEVANNPQVSHFKASEDVSSIIYIDANNLYGGIMLQYPLPLKKFEQVENVTLAHIMEADDEGEIGYILEVDLEYPEDLHDKHADFPLISNKESIDPLELGSFQTEIRNTLKLPAPQSSATVLFPPETKLCCALPQSEVFCSQWHKSYKNTSSCQISSIKVAFQIHSVEHPEATRGVL